MKRWHEQSISNKLAFKQQMTTFLYYLSNQHHIQCLLHFKTLFFELHHAIE